MNSATDLPRRHLLMLAGVVALARPLKAGASAPAPTGWLEPRLPAPAVTYLAADGQRRPLQQVLMGKVTAVQLMFAGCATTCPPQGALFAAVAERMRAPACQLLSLSIDTLGDTPASVQAWQARFGRYAGWQVGVGETATIDRVAEFLKGAPARAGTHTAQVFVFDRLARLTYRSADLPASADIEALLAKLARQA